MINNIIDEMMFSVKKLQEMIVEDLDDVKKAKHQSLSERNSLKQDYMDKIIKYKKNLNEEIVKLLKANEDVNIYREKIDNLELELKKLFELNRKLGQVVLPIRDMYREIVKEVTKDSGGNIIEIKA